MEELTRKGCLVDGVRQMAVPRDTLENISSVSAPISRAWRLRFSEKPPPNKPLHLLTLLAPEAAAEAEADLWGLSSERLGMTVVLFLRSTLAVAAANRHHSSYCPAKTWDFLSSRSLIQEWTAQTSIPGMSTLRKKWDGELHFGTEMGLRLVKKATEFCLEGEIGQRERYIISRRHSGRRQRKT